MNHLVASQCHFGGICLVRMPQFADDPLFQHMCTHASDLPEGAERFSGIDKTSGVRADLVLEAAPWGTQVSFALSNLPGPMQCRLVVMRASGTTEILSTWSVPAAGYGTKEQPMPLLLQAATAAPRDDIERIQVQAVDEHGVARALVTVPV